MRADDIGVAFQAGIAGTPGDVGAAMSQTHDALIEQWGKNRRSGISWLIYGPPLVAAICRIQGHIRNGFAGDLQDGWNRLEGMLATGEETVPDDYLENMKRWAANFMNPTLIIAFCDIRQPREATW